MCDFLMFIISVTGGHYENPPQGCKIPSDIIAHCHRISTSAPYITRHRSNLQQISSHTLNIPGSVFVFRFGPAEKLWTKPHSARKLHAWIFLCSKRFSSTWSQYQIM